MDMSAPVDLHPVDYLVVHCDKPRCLNSLHVEAATYKTPGRSGGLFTRTAVEELFTRTVGLGWELSALGEFAICPPCVDAHVSRRDAMTPGNASLTSEAAAPSRNLSRLDRRARIAA
jgi:hypothetical protein